MVGLAPGTTGIRARSIQRSFVRLHGCRGDLVKVLVGDTQGLCLLGKRLVRGHFVRRPAATSQGVLSLTPQLSMLLEGIDWRMPARAAQPEIAG